MQLKVLYFPYSYLDTLKIPLHITNIAFVSLKTLSESFKIYTLFHMIKLTFVVK